MAISPGAWSGEPQFVSLFGLKLEFHRENRTHRAASGRETDGPSDVGSHRLQNRAWWNSFIGRRVICRAIERRLADVIRQYQKS